MGNKQYYGEQYKRKDGRFGWRLKSSHNGKIVATDGSQGYERAVDCERIFRNLFPSFTLNKLR